MNYRELIPFLHEELKDRENINQEIAWLIQAFSGVNYLDIDLEAPVKKEKLYHLAVERLKRHEPFQYVVGSQDFYGKTFFVNSSVLVPRPETELLCEEAINWGKSRGLKYLKALDLCTGSGCIAITLATNLAGEFFGTDISHDALKIAEKNNQLHKAGVHFSYSDIFFHLPKYEAYDLITANPPYLTQEEMVNIPGELTHEPPLALDGGATGLYAIERIMKEVWQRLNPCGAFFMEIGETQGKQVLNLAGKYGFTGEIHKDLCGKDRLFVAEKVCLIKS